MNLLKQTALILGLASLSLGGWTLVRDWKNKVSILFAALCFVVSVWALSFVASATLYGRLSYDIHLFCNVLLVPLALALISRILMKEPDALSRVLFPFSLVGSSVLGLMIAFSLNSSPSFRSWVLFWPTLIFIEYFHVMILDYRKSNFTRTDSVSSPKKVVLYLGLGLTLSFCTFDHLPMSGFVIPALGNLLFALYLFFANQVIVPQRLLGIEALATRFFAVLILSLMITGFFALLYSYVSASFPLFLLNSFLISFVVLSLWGPLVTFFRYLARRLLSRSEESRQRSLEEFLVRAGSLTEIPELQKATRDFFLRRDSVIRIEFRFVHEGAAIPEPVLRYCEKVLQLRSAPILYRELFEREREQVLTLDRKRELDLLIQFLRALQADVVYPIFRERSLIGWIEVQDLPGGGSGAFPRFNQAIEIFSFLGDCVNRILQIQSARERERLVLLGEMAAGLAHEVRNPLGAIRGAVDLLDSQSSPWTKVIQEEVDRLNRLVSQFLDFSREEGANRERVDLNEVVTQVVRQSISATTTGDVILRTHEAGPVFAIVVPDSVQQILLNLIQNSRKALEGRADPTIEIEVFPTGFLVRDRGIGMSEEIKQKVFLPFFTSFRNGTGLGLSICEKLVRFDHGKVSVQSEDGVGTEVRVEYPRA